MFVLLFQLHVSIHKREEYRKNSFIAPVAIGQIMGFGIAGYVMALDYILGIENGK
ncbi:MAG: type II 3-dehydroquinate dehydratase [Spirochaetales bacterium]|nr:type II 3-dehydroquinate dehydratase [Spirochaetales bacterium]